MSESVCPEMMGVENKVNISPRQRCLPHHAKFKSLLEIYYLSATLESQKRTRKRKVGVPQSKGFFVSTDSVALILVQLDFMPSGELMGK